MSTLNSKLLNKVARKLVLSEVCLDVLTPSGMKYRYRAFVDGVLVIDKVGAGLEFRKEHVARISEIVRHEEKAGNITGVWSEGYLCYTAKAADEVCRRIVKLQTIGRHHKDIPGVDGICRYMTVERFFAKVQEGVKE